MPASSCVGDDESAEVPDKVLGEERKTAGQQEQSNSVNVDIEAVAEAEADGTVKDLAAVAAVGSVEPSHLPLHEHCSHLGKCPED